MNPSSQSQPRWHACVDVGGSKAAVSLAMISTPQGLDLDDPPPALVARRQEPTAKTGASTALALQIERLVHSACKEAGISPTALFSLGVASCGPFVLEDGTISLAAPNICGASNGPIRGLHNDWLHVPIEGPLRSAFPLARVRICNDAVAALHAERRWGALRGSDHCAFITWSTGVGVGLCVDGHVLTGKNGNAGHAGHMFVSDSLVGLCGCGNVGDVEGLLSGSAVQNRYGDPSVFFAQASQVGSPAAQACRIMGRMVYNLAVTLDLERIALGGSIFNNHQTVLLPLLQAELSGRCTALVGGMTLLPAGLGSSAGDFGALAVAMSDIATASMEQD